MGSVRPVLLLFRKEGMGIWDWGLVFALAMRCPVLTKAMLWPGGGSDAWECDGWVTSRAHYSGRVGNVGVRAGACVCGRPRQYVLRVRRSRNRVLPLVSPRWACAHLVPSVG
eukprot:2833632-Rhodomonas_salina.4